MCALPQNDSPCGCNVAEVAENQRWDFDYFVAAAVVVYHQFSGSGEEKQPL